MRSRPIRRPLLWGLLGLGLLLGLLVLGAPATSRLESGSTWHRGPSGYSAWYEAVAQAGVPIQRWQRPVDQLIEQLDQPPVTPVALGQQTLPNVPGGPSRGPETLLVVLPAVIDQSDLPALLPWMPQWIESGHRLVVLGVRRPATAAPFSQMLPSDAGAVQVDTRRRDPSGLGQQAILADDYGAVLWRQSWRQGEGEIALATTPHLGANAYRNFPGNGALLTALVAGDGGRVWVDEYLHGYRDGEAIAAETGAETWLAYLARTPLLILAVQAIAVTLLALVALNRRLGQRRPLDPSSPDNSRAYIEALAGVLHQAGSHDFVVETLGQADRIVLQRSLGLGDTPVPWEQLVAAWGQQTGSAAPDFAALFTPPAPRSDRQLRHWLQRLQSLQHPRSAPRRHGP